jgi:hypothetical protein
MRLDGGAGLLEADDDEARATHAVKRAVKWPALPSAALMWRRAADDDESGDAAVEAAMT